MSTYSYVPAAGSLQPGESAHPHAVRQINGGTHAAYDKNGNMTSGFGRTISWTSFNMPKLIQRNGVSSRFTYDVEHGRIMQEEAQGGVLKRTIYVGGMFEEVNDGAKIERKHYIASPAGRIAIYTQTVDLTPQHLGEITTDTKFLHTDHLGSIDVITNEAGAALERDSFDAWGSRRQTDWQPVAPSIHSIITRGFTGHEQLDDLGLVHMNGRVYDPGLGRFLSADPFVQAPAETQNFNRYSYVLNNPLSLTDPSGFNFLNNFGKWIDQTFGTTAGGVIKAVISYVAYAVVYAVLKPIAGPIVASVGAGFVSGFLSTSLSGASLGQALESGAIFAAVAGISRGVGPLLPAGAQPLLNGGLGAAASAAQDQSPRDGFIAAFITSVFMPAPQANAGGFSGIALRVTVAAVVGGTAAELTGGKFVNGAITAGFIRLFQEEIAFGSQTGTKNAGSATASGFNALTVVVDFIGKIWALPNTVLGLTAQIVLAPFAYANGGGFQLGNNSVQLMGVPFFGGAITIGNTQIYFEGTDPLSNRTYGEINVNTGFHEQFHTYQQQLLGILFWPAYLFSGPMASLRNPFEAAAQDFARRHTATQEGW